MSKEIRAWECEKCRKAYINKVVADNCCKDKPETEFSSCRVCGADIQKHKTICYECLQKERYEKGEKIKYSEYELEWLYDEGSERYFRDIDEIAEYYEDIEIDMPKWVYGCDVIDFNISIDSALESAAENMYEDFDYSNESVDLKELYDFIEAWNKKQTASAYDANYKKIILLNE